MTEIAVNRSFKFAVGVAGGTLAGRDPFHGQPVQTHPDVRRQIEAICIQEFPFLAGMLAAAAA